MRKLILVLLCFLPLQAVFAQSCSSAVYNLYRQQQHIGGTGFCGCQPTSPSTAAQGSNPVTTTINVQYRCTNTSTGNVYFSTPPPKDSEMTAVGACYFVPCNIPGNNSWTCFPLWQPDVKMATGPGDYNRFYNIFNDQEGNQINSLPEWQIGICQQPANGFHQDFWQCAGQFGSDCQSDGGGGGGGGDCYGGPDSNFAPECGTGGDPIILDVEGEGFHLTSLTQGVQFDIRGNQHPVQIAWTDPHFHNAFLVLDVNGNGVVDSGKELFGNFTPQPKSEHPNGFLALALYDLSANGGNGDGFIDAHDAVFSKLRLWIDANHDGISQPGELYTLDHFGIRSLAFGYVSSPKVDKFGNSFRYRALVNPMSEHQEDRDRRKHNGEVGRWAYDVFLSIK